MVDLKFYLSHDVVCNWCYPNLEEELRNLADKFFNTKNAWKNKFSAKKWAEYSKVENEYLKDKRNTCLMLDADHDVHVCKKHLMEVVGRMP